jgi:hypothetical protein
MVKVRIQRMQQALCEKAGKDFPYPVCQSQKTGGRYD